MSAIMAAAHCQAHGKPEAPHLMMRSCCCPPSAAPPTSVLSSKRPASTGLASASPAKRSKKRAFTSPFHEFCLELRPLLPTNLRNSEREKLLGLAWKGLSGTEKRKFKKATPGETLMPPLNSEVGGGWHEGTRVAWAHVPAPQLQLVAPPAPQLQLAAPPAPQMQLITAPQLQFTSAVILPPPAPTAAPVLWATPSVAHWNAGWCASAAAELDLRLPPLQPCMSYPAAPPPALAKPSRASELLTAAAAHRTLAGICLGGQQQLMEEQMEEDEQQQLADLVEGQQQLMEEQMEEDEQQQLADLMEEQMTGEDAVEIAISLGMPH